MNYNNLAQKTNFIASSDKFKNLPFFLTAVNIPGIILNHPEIGGRLSSRLKVTGDTVTFNYLSFDMLIDEDFLIYKEFMDIIRNNVDINTGTFKDIYFDFFIELSNNKGNKIFTLNFSNCRIESIGDIQLDSQDEDPIHTLSVDIAYDYYEIAQQRVLTIIGGTPSVVTPPDDYQQFELNETFASLSDGWQLWGFPTPVLSSDLDSINGQGLDSNGSGEFESGAVFNAVAIDVTRKFEFIFRVKQPLGSDDNNAYYIEFGITEGIGISSTSNGRTGNTLMGVIIDGGSKDSTSIKSTTYKFKSALDNTKADYDNDGEYHEYKFVYFINGTNAEYQIYKDNVLQSAIVGSISYHDFVYIYMQGKSEGGIQILDSVSGSYGEIV